MSSLKIGVMSFAHVHAASYLTDLLSRDDVEVLTADPDGASAPDAGPRGAVFAAAFGAAYVDDYESLLAWRPDAVIVCTENSRHIDAVRLATAAGAHVLCEKPLATNPADAEEMVRLAADAGVFLMSAFPVRFIPAFASLRARVAAGDVGDLMAVLGTNNGKIPIGDRAWFTDPEFSGGGALVDHVVHCADLLDALLGETPLTVHAVSNSILHKAQGVAVETAGLVTIEYPSGVVATIDCSWSQPANATIWGNVGLEVVGSRGALTFEGISRSVHGTDRDGGVWLPFGVDMNASMLSHFVDSLRDGVAPQPDGEVGVRTTRIVDAALESARTGRPVSLTAP